MGKTELKLADTLNEQELEQAMEFVKKHASKCEIASLAKELVENTESMLRKYKSKRLEGIQGKWTDVEFLRYIKEKIDYRSAKEDIKEASNQRIEAIIKKLEGESK